MDRHTVCIVGGGVAGLSAARRLLEHGIKPLLIDAGTIPAHKVCGEFFSSESLPYLRSWGLLPKVSVHKVRYTIERNSYDFLLPQSAGAESRLSFDGRLLASILEAGAEVRLNTKVSSIEEGIVHLASGEVINPAALLIGTGRIDSKKMDLRYYGIKSHRFMDRENDLLEMQLYPGAYLGISPIEGGQVNIACLARKEVVDRVGSIEEYMRTLWKGPEGEWMSVQVPPFGMPKLPNWKNVYFIGDAAGRVTPSTGCGLASAVISGVMAADYAVKGNWAGFQKAWGAILRRRLYWDKAVHGLMMRPALAQKAFRLGQAAPFVFETLFHKTRVIN